MIIQSRVAGPMIRVHQDGRGLMMIMIIYEQGGNGNRFNGVLLIYSGHEIVFSHVWRSVIILINNKCKE